MLLNIDSLATKTFPWISLFPLLDCCLDDLVVEILCFDMAAEIDSESVS